MDSGQTLIDYHPLKMSKSKMSKILILTKEYIFPKQEQYIKTLNTRVKLWIDPRRLGRLFPNSRSILLEQRIQRRPYKEDDDSLCRKRPGPA